MWTASPSPARYAPFVDLVGVDCGVCLLVRASFLGLRPIRSSICILTYTQVVVGGKNKYLINGAAVQASQVQNLFHSVQLNVNNPHFLIMQGRITKVCVCVCSSPFFRCVYNHPASHTNTPSSSSVHGLP